MLAQVLEGVLTIVVASRCVPRTTKANRLSDFSMLSETNIDQATFNKMKASAVREDTSKK